MVARALVREVPTSFTRALAMTAPASPIDVGRAREQHLAYQRALRACHAEITVIAADEACPDCVFVEDTAVIADGLALITRPGAPSRRPETMAIARALGAVMKIVHMDTPAIPPALGAAIDLARGAAPAFAGALATMGITGIDPSATLDGGDVMRVGRVFYVGRSARTSAAGIAFLQRTFEPRGYRVVALDLPPGVLHLKCVVSPLADDTILLADASLPPELFAGLRIVRAPREETYAANAVAVGEHVIVAQEFPRTHEALAAAGFTLHPVPTTEVRKADGSLTCQSLLY
jgi:dimethylargininase